jgi:hypothetical protein
MSPGEVKGLQALAMAHGGSLSINPDTGLVEASFLKRILPMIAGVGLSMIPGVGPFAAAGMVGGFETLRTGDIGKGLMAGLGAYGGAGLAGSLAGTGASAAGTAATEATMAANPQLAGSEIAREMGTAGFNAPTLAANTNPAAMTMADKMGAGFNQITSSPGALGGFAKDNLMNIGAAAAPILGDVMTPEVAPIPGMPEEDPRYAGAPYNYKLSPNFSGYVPRQPQPYYRPTGLGYAAEGGSTSDIMMAAGGSYEDEPMGDVASMAAGGIATYNKGGTLKMKTMSLGQGIARDTDPDTAGLGAYEAAKKRVEKQYSAANLKANKMPKSSMDRLGQIKVMAEGGLGGYSDGGRMLKGPGDGMSDSIPATIGRKQPARLADGEFVVPADVVSHLGNGSTDAGAKKLYAMMDKIRTARTGKKKQAPAVKGDKYLPKFAEGGDVSSTAEVSAPAFSYPGSGMSLADITSLGNLIARGNSGLAQAPIQTPMQGFTDADLIARLTAAQANRPVSEPISFNLKPYTDTPSSGLSRLFRNFGRASESEEDSFTDSKGNVYVRRT